MTNGEWKPVNVRRSLFISIAYAFISYKTSEALKLYFESIADFFVRGPDLCVLTNRGKCLFCLQ